MTIIEALKSDDYSLRVIRARKESMRIRIQLVVEIDENIHGNTEEEKEAFRDLVLYNEAEPLYLHSNYIGQEVGSIVALEKIEYLDKQASISNIRERKFEPFFSGL